MNDTVGWVSWIVANDDLAARCWQHLSGLDSSIPAGCGTSVIGTVSDESFVPYYVAVGEIMDETDLPDFRIAPADIGGDDGPCHQRPGQHILHTVVVPIHPREHDSPKEQNN